MLQRARRGFSLTEFAIVLGVIGAILGSLWSLIGIAWENYKQERASEEITSVVQNIRAFYGAQAGIPATATVSVMVSEGIFPGETLRSGGGCSLSGMKCPDNPWGATATNNTSGSFAACGWKPGTTTSCAAPATATAEFFAVELSGLSQASCIKASTRNSGYNAPPGLTNVYVNKASIFPVTVSAAKAQCTASSTLDFIFRLSPAL